MKLFLIFANFLIISISLSSSKKFNKCELAQEIKNLYDAPIQEIATYVCIAEHQSQFDTESIGQATYYGMFQISSEYWCDTDRSGKTCNLNCRDLLNEDLSDDLQCVKTIIEKHENAYTAWPSGVMCKSMSHKYLSDCLVEKIKVASSTEKYIRSAQRQNRILGSDENDNGKIYDRCELARELKYQHNMPSKEIGIWVCIAKHESNFNTSAIGRLNWDGSEDHGIFQISDLYWCGGENGKGCGLSCESLRDSDIKNDVECIKSIHKEHTRLFGDGFQAWTVYPRCKQYSEELNTRECFDFENEIEPFTPISGVVQTKNEILPKEKSVIKEKGKVYERCELALELRFKHGIPIDKIATWVCIANHESNFNTSAIGRLNWDGSEDHGIFQISDLYWCSKESHAKGCNLLCSELEDNDITDDVECMLKIYQEHAFLSGDGFNAWTTYPRCKDVSDQYIKGCFQNDIRPGIVQPHPTFSSSTPPMLKTLQTTKALPRQQFESKTDQLILEDTTTMGSNNAELSEKLSPKTKNSFGNHLNDEKKQQNESINKSPVLKNAAMGMLKEAIKEQKNSRTLNTTKMSHSIRATTTMKKTKTTIPRSKTKSKFNIFAFYLNDFTSKPSINYKPIQFSSKKSLITTRKPILENYHDHDKRINIVKNRFGNGNITPHSIDYLLKLTTPRNLR